MCENGNVIMFFDLCRLCLAKRGLCDIFDQAGLQSDITICTGIKIVPSDNLPRKICEPCWGVVKNAMELRLLATKNDFHLKSLFDDDTPDAEFTICDVVVETFAPSQPSKEVADQPSSNDKQAQPSIAVRKDLFQNPETKENKPKEFEKKKRKHEKRKQSHDKTNTSTECDTKEIEKKKKEHEKRKHSHDKTNTSTECDTTETKDVKEIKKIKRERCTDALEIACDECSKTFETFKKLYLHRRLHNKTIICPLDTCEKKFATKGDLAKHFRTHTGEKPYECEICKKTFTQRVTLRTHKDTVHSLIIKK